MTASLLYRSLQRALRAATPVLARGSFKVARSLAGKRGAARSLAAWGGAHRDATRPAVWLHAPSVGEGLQAQAVLEALRARRPGLQAVFTHLSPSAEGLAARMSADWAGYLPWDLPDEMASALDAARPDVVAFTKTEVWPILVEEASRRRIPVALVGGTVPAGARRAGQPARSLLRSTWARLSLVGAVSDADAERFAMLGVPAGAIRVTGDPGVDSAAERARRADPDAPWLRPFREDPRPTLVAGSTWPSDLEVLLPAFERARERVADFRAVVAPHEPTGRQVGALLAESSRRGWRARSLSEVEKCGVASVDVVVVDRVGVLAHLYTVGDAAYVGGGFHDAGLHSVLEPAAARTPVLFGPRHANARAAWDLLLAGGAKEVRGAEELAEVVAVWLNDHAARNYAALRAFGYIDAHLGAAARSAGLLDVLITPR